MTNSTRRPGGRRLPYAGPIIGGEIACCSPPPRPARGAGLGALLLLRVVREGLQGRLGRTATGEWVAEDDRGRRWRPIELDEDGATLGPRQDPADGDAFLEDLGDLDGLLIIDGAHDGAASYWRVPGYVVAVWWSLGSLTGARVARPRLLHLLAESQRWPRAFGGAE